MSFPLILHAIIRELVAMPGKIQYLTCHLTLYKFYTDKAAKSITICIFRLGSEN